MFRVGDFVEGYALVNKKKKLICGYVMKVKKNGNVIVNSNDWNLGFKRFVLKKELGAIKKTTEVFGLKLIL